MIASWSASGPIAQNTVSRMIIGGSTGLRMMIALPAVGPADLRDGLAGGVGELVDVGAGARAGGARRDRRDDLRVGHRRDPRDRVHDRDGRLAAAGDHVDVRGVEVGGAVDRRAHHRPDVRRGEVDGLDAGLRVARRVRDVCGLAEVASKTMSGSGSWRSSQSTPSGGGGRSRVGAPAPARRTPRPRPCRRPRSRCCARSLASRSVPMFPGPTMAAMLMPRRVTATTVVWKPNVPVNGTRPDIRPKCRSSVPSRRGCRPSGFRAPPARPPPGPAPRWRDR